MISPREASAASPLKIFGLSDKTITKSGRLVLEGQALRAVEVTVNGQKVDIDNDGMFKTGLVVAPGKNLVIVSARWGGSEEKKTIRILRLVSFPDVEELYQGAPHWAKADILNLATLGIVEGYPDGIFLPKKDISRGELVTWLVRAEGDEVKKPAEDPFSDVPREHWRAPYIREAVVKGYVSGYSKDAFGIDDPIKREDAIAVVDRARRLKDAEEGAKVFQDVPEDNREYLKIYRAYKAGLVIGVSRSKKMFQPGRLMRRDEMAEVLSRFPGIKDQARELADFEEGYDRSKLCRVNTEPLIPWVKAVPYDIPRSGRTPLAITAKVIDRQGQADISQVRVDLRPIGGPPDALMYDNGSHGDEKARDGIYTLKVAVYEDTEIGVKHLNITAIDKSGWKAQKSVEINVVKQW